MNPTNEQLAAAKTLLRDQYPDCWASPVETIPRVAALIARAESAEAERDGYKAALEDLTTGTATPKWSYQAERELGPIWREAQAEMTSRAANALAAGEGAKA